MPTVSVVMPLYNTEKFVHAAIVSVLAQTFADFELIVVDDGSTDQSVEICRQFRDRRIRLLQQENRGLAGARNTGIRHARGNFVALLDADDSWEPEKLALHVAHLQHNPRVGVSYSQSAFMDEQGEKIGIVQAPKLKRLQAADILCRNPVGNGSSPVIRKAVFDAIAFERQRGNTTETCYFDEDLRQSEDIECWLRIATLTAWSFEGLSQTLTWYRVNNGGLSANLEKQYRSWLTVLDKAGRYAPDLVASHGRLAEAYQLRYLARRAVRSRDAKNAWDYMQRALRKDWRIVLLEPGRTTVTLSCSVLLNLLPLALYNRLERGLMQSAGTLRKLAAG